MTWHRLSILYLFVVLVLLFLFLRWASRAESPEQTQARRNTFVADREEQAKLCRHDCAPYPALMKPYGDHTCLCSIGAEP